MRRIRRDGASPATRIRMAADLHRHSTSDDDSGCVADEYTWSPSTRRPDTVHAYFSALPPERVPIVGSHGEKWRERQLRHQLPPQDSDHAYCGHLSTAKEKADLAFFHHKRLEECLGRGEVQTIPYGGGTMNCAQCEDVLGEGSVCVYSERTAAWFHPACFFCHTCKELLVDLVYFAHEGRLYCGRHHAEKYRPRCARCDELIFSEDCTEAEGHSWHVHHFCCTECDAPLGGHSYGRSASGQPICRSCKSNPRRVPAAPSAVPSPAGLCSACRVPFSPSDALVCHAGLSWHATGSCFRCLLCRRSLLGLPFSLFPPSSSLRCSPYCPRPSHSLEHIYETVEVTSASMSRPSASSSSARQQPRPLHSSKSERLSRETGNTLASMRIYSSSSSMSSSDEDLEEVTPPPPPAPSGRTKRTRSQLAYTDLRDKQTIIDP